MPWIVFAFEMTTDISHLVSAMTRDEYAVDQEWHRPIVKLIASPGYFFTSSSRKNLGAPNSSVTLSESITALVVAP